MASIASQRDNPTGDEFTYAVQEGDTLAAIAERYHTSVDALATLNYLQDPAHLEVGRELRIPATGPGGTTPVGPTGQPVARGAEMTTYTVQTGESLADIALRLGSTVDDLTRLNQLDDPKNIQPGDQLFIPSVPEGM